SVRERTPFPRAVLAALPNLKLLITSGLYNASIDGPAAREHGIQVAGSRMTGNGTAELTWGLILALARKIPQEDANVRSNGWQSNIGLDLSGKTLGLVGLGKLGAQVAKVGLAFGMRVVAWSANLTAARCAEVSVHKAASLEALMKESDVVSVHVVLSDRSRGLIGRRELGWMKRTAYIVNTSRGPIIDENALVEALAENRIAGAGLDVFDVEPLPVGHTLRNLPNTVLTPHVGYVVESAYKLAFR
ncbi:hypothetical protein M427DRAFT_95653, partial [Gonapodya prolifera JEL478]